MELTRGGRPSRAGVPPPDALNEAAELLAENKLVVSVQTFPFDHAAEAYRISRSGHIRGKLVLVP